MRFADLGLAGISLGLFLAAVPAAALAAAGDVDTSFDIDGFAITNLANTSDNSGAYGAAVQDDGKVVVVGYSWAKNEDFAVVRYGTNGEPDPAFGENGKVTTAIGTGIDVAQGVAIQTDGKIVVAGYALVGGFQRFAVVRYLSDGTLDTTFDGDGKLTTNVGTGHAQAVSVAIQADGAIVVGGHAQTGGNYDLAAVRYLSNGALDTTFSGDGIVTTGIDTGNDYARTVLLQGTKVIVAGVGYYLGDDDVVAVRYNADGTLDTTFGGGDGKATADLTGSSLNDLAGSAALQTDGKIVVSGSAYVSTDYDFAVVRFTLNGSLDSTFDSDGVVITDLGLVDNFANGITIRPTGEIVAAGYTDNAGNYDFAAVRYDPANGALDTAFSTDGKQTATVGTLNDVARVIVAQGDGKVVLAGDAQPTTGGYDFGLVRFTTAGALDTTYSGDGRVLTPVGANSDYGQGVAVQDDGKIVVVGYSQDNTIYYAAIARYLANGSLDTGFGTKGKVVVDLGTGASILNAVEIDSSGRIVVAGSAWNGANWDIVAARFLSDGSPDTGFSGDGKVLVPVGTSHDYATALALQSDGKPVIAGYASMGANLLDFAAVRLTTAGATDSTFSGDGKNTFAVLAEDDKAYAVAIQGDGKIVLAGSAFNGVDDDFAIVRVLANGNIDTGFGASGTTTTSMGFGYDRAFGVQVDSGGRIVAAGESFNGSNGDFAVARYLTDGSPDLAFSLDGWLRTGLVGPSYSDGARGVRIQSDGRIVVGGFTAGVDSLDFGVVRYEAADGSLDTSFGGGDGIATMTLGAYDVALAMDLQVNSRIVLAGYTDPLAGIGKDFGVARFLVEGTCGNSVVELGETCDDGNVVDGDCCSSGCQYDVAGTACGSGADSACDNPDTCNGSGTCLENYETASFVCRASAGVCDPAETCTGSTADCPVNTFSTAVCRPSAGICDVAESCTGTGATCPANGFSTAVCRAAAGVCDNAEICSGTGATCPADSKKTTATTCRAAAGVCDNAEVCNGTAVDCPADAKKSSATACRATAGICDIAENCTGVDADCPADVLRTTTTTCRAASGVCDVAETCSGASPTCPANGFASTVTPCRAATGVCDAVEMCTGTAATCPANALHTTATTCRVAAGSCDNAEVCSGTSANCPADGRKPSTAPCRTAAGVCDLTENCTGTSNDCPVDALRPAAFVCRAAAGDCDVTEACDGSAVDCPADVLTAEDTPCTSDSNACTEDVCDGAGTCLHDDITATCDDGDACSTDSCDPGIGCVNDFVPRPDNVCLVAPKQSLQVKLGSDSSKHQLKWKWSGGEAFGQGDLGTPDVATEYRLCVYDTALDVPSFVAGFDVSPGPLWVGKDPKGYGYKDKEGASDGVTKVSLKTGDASKTKAQLAAKGGGMPTITPASSLTVFDQDPKVVVQLLNSEGMCLTSQFDAGSATKNDGYQFKAKTK